MGAVLFVSVTFKLLIPVLTGVRVNVSGWRGTIDTNNVGEMPR